MHVNDGHTVTTVTPAVAAFFTGYTAYTGFTDGEVGVNLIAALLLLSYCGGVQTTGSCDIASRSMTCRSSGADAYSEWPRDCATHAHAVSWPSSRTVTAPSRLAKRLSWRLVFSWPFIYCLVTTRGTWLYLQRVG